MAHFRPYKTWIACCAALLLFFSAQSPGRAAIWFELPELVVNSDGVSPTTGFFDVVVRADASESPTFVTAYNLDFYTTSSSLKFAPAAPAPNPLIVGTPLNFAPNVHYVRAAQDLPSGDVQLVDGMALVRVPFEVRPGEEGVFPLAFGLLNELADPEALSIGLQTADTGSITVHVGIPGDYNASGSVGPEDYELWRSTFGSTSTLSADGNGDGVVDAGDYVIWRRNLGTGTSSMVGHSMGMAVFEIPEPTTLIVLLTGTAIVLARALARRP